MMTSVRLPCFAGADLAMLTICAAAFDGVADILHTENSERGRRKALVR